MSKMKVDAVSNPDSRSGLDSAKASGSAKSLAKGLTLIELLAEASGPLRMVDLVDRSGIPRPTAIRLIEVLCRAEVVRASPDGTYRLGPRTAAWGHAFLNSIDLPGAAADLIEELVGISGETCYVGVLDERSVLYIAAAHSPHAIRPAARVGSRMPLHCTGIGKVLLSACTDEERTRLLPESLERRTPNTIVERDKLDAHLRSVSEQGYATDEIENEDGVRCVAAPIKDHTGAVVAAISISAPAYRFTHADLERLKHVAVDIARQISSRLGHADQDELAPASAPEEGETDDE